MPEHPRLVIGDIERTIISFTDFVNRHPMTGSAFGELLMNLGSGQKQLDLLLGALLTNKRRRRFEETNGVTRAAR